MPFLLFFTALCIGATFFIASLDPLLGLVLFIVANFAYQAALIYYDALLKTVSYPATRGKLSGLGTGIGYCGTVFVGLLIFFLDVPVADRFRLTSILFLVFAIPIFVFVREPRIDGQKAVTAAEIRDAFGQLRRSIAHAREVPGLGRFLLGRFFYSDAVNTVIVVMSIVVVQTMGLSDAERQPRPAAADRGRDRDELRVGHAGGPAGPQEDARLGPRLVGGRAGARRGRDRVRAGRARARSSWPGRSSDRGSAGSRWRTAC